ncbi:TrbM/KikA/MpfK family conjugal transfer protein [Raoultella terrigena]|uniref:TrbM/KikA/MpfK family conjugal transfer protein n=1 Tax=Raoultella terrigena TaxID=577 RepID=UPI000908116C|nr:TrbM/KikA/MpfK family conjugal transfer protein [Raoultella terrigena]
MRKAAIAAVMLCAAASNNAFAEESANPDDPCAMVLCLAGKLNVGSPAECDPMYKSFMSIKKRNKYGFLPGHTSDARKGKLNQCPAADRETINKIISKFGRLSGW